MDDAAWDLESDVVVCERKTEWGLHEYDVELLMHEHALAWLERLSNV